MNLIIEFYRIVIGLIFIGGAIVAAAAVISNAGGNGLAVGLLIMAGTASLTGVSAILLSINDHLAALRNK